MISFAYWVSVGLTRDVFFAFGCLMHCKMHLLVSINDRRKTGIGFDNQGSVGEIEKSKQTKCSVLHFGSWWVSRGMSFLCSVLWCIAKICICLCVLQKKDWYHDDNQGNVGEIEKSKQAKSSVLHFGAWWVSRGMSFLPWVFWCITKILHLLVSIILEERMVSWWESRECWWDREV